MGTVSPYIRTKKYASFFTMSKTFWIIVFVYLMKARGEAEDSSSLVDDDSTKSAADPVDTQDDVDAASAVAAVKDAVEGKNDEILAKLENLTAEIRAHYAKPRTPTGIARIAYEGSAGSSTESSGYAPKYAFHSIGSHYFHSQKGMPQAIWFRFSKPHRLAKIGITSHQNRYAPKRFNVVGSNDCASWTSMLTVFNSGFPDNTHEETRYWSISAQNRMAFTCIGLNVKTNPWSGYPYLLLNNIMMWEEV